MTNEHSLIHRYTFGSNDVSWYTPGTPQHAFLIGMPNNVRDLVKVNHQIVKNMQSIQGEIQKSSSLNVMALNEIGKQISNLQLSMSQGFSEMSDAIYHLEDELCINLSEIKWVLGQMDSKLAYLVHLIKFPRQTEASELVEDGVKAISTGNIDDAEACLLKAVEMKRTSFQAHMNLGFVYLHKNDANSAITHFKKAVDYSPEEEVRKFALENLARSYFADMEFSKAKEMMEQAGFYGSYHYAVYLALSGYVEKGISIIVGLCKSNPSYYAIAATDQDLNPIRDELIKALDNLAKSENEKGKAIYKKAKEECEKTLGGISEGNRIHIEKEITLLQEALQSSENWLNAQNYSDSVRAIKTCTAISSICPRLPELASIKSNVSEAGKDLEAKREEYGNAQARVRREEDDTFREQTSMNEQRESTKDFARKMESALGCVLPLI